MVVGAILGYGVGLVGGISLGAALFSKLPQAKIEEYQRLHINQDKVEGILADIAAGKPLANTDRKILKDMPPWAMWPDYEPVQWIQNLMDVLWPHINTIVNNQLKVMLPQIINDLPNKQPNLVKFLKYLQDVDVELELGNRAPLMGGFKVYNTSEDEVILETQIKWGSNISIKVAPLVGVSSCALKMPVEVKNIAMEARARITLKPLTEVIPCLGGLTVQLLGFPKVDLHLALYSGFDLMALPGVPEVVDAVIKAVVGPMMVYPNYMSVPLMPNYGVPMPPKGMITVRELRCQGLPSTFTDKVDPYVVMKVGEREAETDPIDNNENPDWKDEEFYVVVDDPDSGRLLFEVYDSDMFTEDDLLGTAYVDLKGANCIAAPGIMQEVELPVMMEVSPAAAKKAASAVGNVGKKLTSGVGKVAFAPIRMIQKRRGKNKAQESSDGREEEAEVEPELEPEVELVNGKKKKKKQLPLKRIGTLFAAIEYKPFAAPPEEEVKVHDPISLKKKLSRVGTFKPRDTMKGLLTVKLFGCRSLLSETGSVDAYVVFELYDPANPKVQRRRSKIEFNEANPKWSDKYDFVNISATSRLVATVYDKRGLWEGLKSLKVPFVKKDDPKVGVLRLELEEVVKNGEIKDVWPLDEAQQGDIELRLQWHGLAFA